MRYEGYTGQFAVEGDAIIITREGMNARMGFGKTAPRRIPLAAVSGVEFIDATRLKNGYLQLGLGGRPMPKLGMDAPSDSDTVVFVHKNRDQFRSLYEWLLTVVQHNSAAGIDPTAIEYETGMNRVEKMQRKTAERAAGAEGRPDVIAAVARLNQVIGGLAEIGHLGSHLRDDETVLFIAQGTYEGDEGIVVLTDRRVLFLFHGILRQRTEDFPLRIISSVQVKTGLRYGDLKLFAAGNDAKISKVRNVDLTPLAEAIREYIARASAPVAAAAPPNPAPQSPVEQLRQLAELHAAGILTDAEFAMKKQELLSRM